MYPIDNLFYVLYPPFHLNFVTMLVSLIKNLIHHHVALCYQLSHCPHCYIALFCITLSPNCCIASHDDTASHITSYHCYDSTHGNPSRCQIDFHCDRCLSLLSPWHWYYTFLWQKFYLCKEKLSLILKKEHFECK